MRRHLAGGNVLGCTGVLPGGSTRQRVQVYYMTQDRQLAAPSGVLRGDTDFLPSPIPQQNRLSASPWLNATLKRSQGCRRGRAEQAAWRQQDVGGARHSARRSGSGPLSPGWPRQTGRRPGGEQWPAQFGEHGQRGVLGVGQPGFNLSRFCGSGHR